MFIQLITIFVAAIFLTVAEVLDGYVTIVKNDKKRAVFWGFFSWILAGTIIVNISGTIFVKVLSIVFAGLGAAYGNLLGIKIIQILKKQKRTKKPFTAILLSELKKSSVTKLFRQTLVYKSIRKAIRKIRPKRQVFQNIQPVLSFFR